MRMRNTGRRALTLGAMMQIWLLAGAEVVIGNGEFTLTIGDDARATSLVHEPSGEECLAEGVSVPLCIIRQYRPYDNENFLMFPAKPRDFESNRCRMENDTLIVEFADTYDIAKIKVDVTPDYIAMRLVGRDYRIEDYGVKRKTELDEFTMLNLPIRHRVHKGEWLNTVWDDSLAVALVATAPETFVDMASGRDEESPVTLSATAHTAVKLFDAGAALMVTHPDSLLDRIDALEADFDMPRGVKSRRHNDYNKSYYELRGVTPGNIDHNIELARQAGMRTMVVYYTDFAKACGHFEWRSEYPRGMADLQEITRKITDAGMIPGLHIHYSKIAVTDPYINNGIPDRRGNVVGRFTLKEPLNEYDSIIIVEERPEAVRMEDGRRLLHIDDELVMFDDVRLERPYAFTGCRRGMYNSSASSHDARSEARHLDVDDWPLFIRVDQNTDIQREIAERLGEIYADCGFRFVYFDGAEDVPMPYWYNVSRSQLEVYKAMNPAPLWAEGAQKSHYGWHILSRGNAFDIFPPERIRQAMKRYTLRCAEQVACDFTSVNFGWVNYKAPDAKTIGMQPDMFDYICSKALAWNCPISLVANVPEIERHPRTDDNLSAIRMWEDAKIFDHFDENTRLAMRDPDREWTIVERNGDIKALEVRQITPDSLNAIIPVRAFSHVVDHDTTSVIYWNVSAESVLTLGVPDKNVRLEDFMTGRRLKIKRDKNGNIVLPVGKRRILTLPMKELDARKLFIDALNQSED